MPIATEIKLLQKSKRLEISFDNGKQFSLSCEYLRVHSPSAEVQGHGGPGVLQTGKKDVNIIAIETVGHYAIKIIFDDGHSSGIFSWGTLYDLGNHYDEYWHTYLKRLEQEGGSREPAANRN